MRRLRLERAAGQLRHSRSAVVDIALAAGYDSHEAFSRAFARAFALSPTQYRRRPDAPVHLSSRSGIHFQADQTLRRFRTVALRSFAMKVTTQSLPSIRVACLRHTGPYDQCGSTWDRLFDIVGPDGDLGPGTQFYGISYDDPENTPPEQVRYDAGISIDEHFVARDGLTIRVIPAGDYAMLTHEGPYAGLKNAYRHLMGEWLPRSGRELGDTPCFESYLNDPATTPPAELLTDIFAPLRPVQA